MTCFHSGNLPRDFDLKSCFSARIPEEILFSNWLHDEFWGFVESLPGHSANINGSRFIYFEQAESRKLFQIKYGLESFGYPEHHTVDLPVGYGANVGSVLLIHWIKTNKIDAYAMKLSDRYRVYFKSADDAMWAKLSFDI